MASSAVQLPVVVGPSLTVDQAREIYALGEEAVIFAMLELAGRLRDLDRRRVELRRLEQEKARDELVRQRRADARTRRPWMVLAAVTLAVAIAVSFALYRKAFSTKPQIATVALLPFRNATSD